MAHRLGMKPNWVVDLHNGGCAAFVMGLKLARNLLASGEGRTAMIAVAQNSAGTAFDRCGLARGERGGERIIRHGELSAWAAGRR